MKNITKKIHAVVIVSLLSLASAMPATATPDRPMEEDGAELSIADERKLVSVLDEREVSAADQEALIAAVEEGTLPEADRMGEVDPVSIEESSAGGDTRIKYTFSDGSVGFLTVSEGVTSEGGAQAPVVAGLSATAQSDEEAGASATQPIKYVTKKRIAYDGISFSYSFLVDYHYRKTAKIDKAYNGVVHRAILHDVSSRSVGIVKERSTSRSNAAWARFSFDMTAVKVLWSRTVTLDFFAHGSWSKIETNL